MKIELTEKQLLTIDHCLTITVDEASDNYEMTEGEKLEIYTDVSEVFSVIKHYLPKDK